jgi:hypothetical protein
MLFRRRQTRPSPAAVARRASVRPSLECLETRDAPAALLTSLTFSNVSSSFSPSSLSMTDKLTVSVVTSPSTPVTTGQISVSDGGQSQTATLNSGSNGQASFTFTFSLGQLLSNPLLLFPHTVTGSYSDSTGVNASSSGSVAAPGVL